MNNLPASPFIISTVVLIIWVIYLRANRRKVTVLGTKEDFVKELLALAKKSESIKRDVLEHCANYCAALRITEGDFKNLEEAGKNFIVKMKNDEITLIFKSTCGEWPENQYWKTILQVRSKRPGVMTIGGGTKYIEVLSAEDHKAALEAISEGNFRTVDNCKIWP